MGKTRHTKCEHCAGCLAPKTKVANGWGPQAGFQHCSYRNKSHLNKQFDVECVRNVECLYNHPFGYSTRLVYICVVNWGAHSRRVYTWRAIIIFNCIWAALYLMFQTNPPQFHPRIVPYIYCSEVHVRSDEEDARKRTKFLVDYEVVKRSLWCEADDAQLHCRKGFYLMKLPSWLDN